MTDRDTLVTVVMAAFNAERFIGQAIDSVLSQTIDAVEVIICDDCSTDHTPEIVSRYASNDTRVVLIRNTVNSGPAAARSRCLDAASGKWIAILDADDVFCDTARLEKMLYQADLHGATMVFDNMLFLSESGEPIKPAMNPTDVTIRITAADYANRDAHRSFGFAFLQPIIRRDVIGALW